MNYLCANVLVLKRRSRKMKKVQKKTQIEIREKKIFSCGKFFENYNIVREPITSGNFLMLIFVSMYISFLYVPRMPKNMFTFFLVLGTLPNFFLKIEKKITNSIIVTCLPFIILNLSQYLGPTLFLAV